MSARKYKILRAVGFVLVAGFTGAVTAANAEQVDVATLDNGDRIIVTYHFKIEHRAKSAIDIFVHQIGTPEGRKILGAALSAIGVDPTIASIVSANVPLPAINAEATENRGILSYPGMTICKAGPVGDLETSHASWSGRIVRSPTQDGLGYYTAVGTSPGTTHRIQGNFFVEFVKPVDGWEQKYGCMKTDELAWNKSG
jgi:hypothetical protein